MATEVPTHRCRDCDATFSDPLTRNVESPQKYPEPLPRGWGVSWLPNDVPFLCGACDGKRRARMVGLELTEQPTRSAVHVHE